MEDTLQQYTLLSKSSHVWLLDKHRCGIWAEQDVHRGNFERQITFRRNKDDQDWDRSKWKPDTPRPCPVWDQHEEYSHLMDEIEDQYHEIYEGI